MLDERLVQFSVAGVGQGKRCVRIVGNGSWVEQEPFMAVLPEHRHQWRITVQSLYSLPMHFAIGAWWYHWWEEGGWNQLTIGGYETKEFLCWSHIPAEEGTFPWELNLGFVYPAYPAGGFPLQVIQNPDFLIPNQRPSNLGVWSGLKDLPIPVSPHEPVVSIQSIRFPYPSTDYETQGEITAKLLSPKDYDKWMGWLCSWSPTEMRCGRTLPNGVASEYRYNFFLNDNWTTSNQRERLGSSPVKVLTTSDSSGVFTLPFTIKPLSPGNHSIFISWWVEIDGENHPMFFDTDPYASRSLRYALLGYFNL